MDIYHKILEVARKDQLHVAPLYVNPQEPPRILDLGCGTGIWAIDMADKYPTAEVVGLDLVNIQPERYENQRSSSEPIGSVAALLLALQECNPLTWSPGSPQTLDSESRETTRVFGAWVKTRGI